MRIPDYETYAPAYQYGWESKGRYPGRKYSEVESDLASGWGKTKGAAKLGWDKARHATRDAWDRLELHCQAMPMATENERLCDSSWMTDKKVSATLTRALVTSLFLFVRTEVQIQHSSVGPPAMKSYSLRVRGFESVEPRYLMAGNVTATQVGDDLVLVGDNLANSLSIRQGIPGQFSIRGEDTTVNSGDTTSSPVAFTGITGNVVIRLSGGNDRLKISRLNRFRSVKHSSSRPAMETTTWNSFRCKVLEPEPSSSLTLETGTTHCSNKRLESEQTMSLGREQETIR